MVQYLNCVVGVGLGGSPVLGSGKFWLDPGLGFPPGLGLGLGLFQDILATSLPES